MLILQIGVLKKPIKTKEIFIKINTDTFTTFFIFKGVLSLGLQNKSQEDLKKANQTIQ